MSVRYVIGPAAATVLLGFLLSGCAQDPDASRVNNSMTGVRRIEIIEIDDVPPLRLDIPDPRQTEKIGSIADLIHASGEHNAVITAMRSKYRPVIDNFADISPPGSLANSIQALLKEKNISVSDIDIKRFEYSEGEPALHVYEARLVGSSHSNSILVLMPQYTMSTVSAQLHLMLEAVVYQNDPTSSVADRVFRCDSDTGNGETPEEQVAYWFKDSRLSSEKNVLANICERKVAGIFKDSE